MSDAPILNATDAVQPKRQPRLPRCLALVSPDLTSDFLSGIFALRRVIRHGSDLDIAAVRAELRYLDRFARREERRIARTSRKEAA